MLRSLFLSLALALAATLLPAAASARVPRDWSGVMVDYPQLLNAPNLLRSEFAVMKANRVARVRMALYWSQAQPYRRMQDVPATFRSAYTVQDGVPTNLSGFDRTVEDATRRGIAILPVVVAAPPWAEVPNPGGTFAHPRRPADYARFLTALVRRYGPRGTFWDEHPFLARRPIRQWQIWNEPNLPAYWRQPFARGYTALLWSARRALRAADPGARIVAAGLTSTSWEGLAAMYRAGARGSFDTVALNTFASEPRKLLRVLTLCRIIQKRYRNITPILLSEITWDASRGRSRFFYPWSTRPGDQARKLYDAYKLMARVRLEYKIQGVFWYSWMTGYNARDPFDYSGLRVWRGTRTPGSKPPLAAFKRVMAGL